jgi:hypothetical protein
VLGSGYLQRSDVYEVSPASETDDPGNRTFTPQMDPWDTATDSPAGFTGTSKPTVAHPNGVAVTGTGGRAIQRAVEAAYNASGNQHTIPKLVVIYPNTAPNYAPHNAFAAYFENVVLHSNVRLQGVGTGSINYTNNVVNGTNIDASQFWSATQVVPLGTNQQDADGSYSDGWRTFANGLTNAGTTTELPEGEGVLAIAERTDQYDNRTRAFKPGVDGVLLTGGDQQGNPGNVNTAPGAVLDGVPGPTPPGPAQGGAVMVDQYVTGFAINNNVVQANGGTYGTIRIGTPDLPAAQGQQIFQNHNDRLVVANNRIVGNGGTNLAGALGIFQGTDNYTVSGNDFCGNFSAEYGGAISHYGSSPGGKILHNRIYYNQGYDEGGGVFIAGELPANNTKWVKGAGDDVATGAAATHGVTVDGNLIVANQSNDDGGGLRFLMAGSSPMQVQNNIIANNVSSHEGGGVALDDTSNVTFVNNTVVKNITTATASTNAALADGVKPANPAGLSTARNGSVFQGSLPSGAANWSKPKMLNNVFLDNRAGWAQLPTTQSFNQSALHGIGEAGDVDTNNVPVPIQRWDVGIAGGSTGLHNDGGSAFLFDGATNTTNTRAGGNLVHVDGAPVAYQGSPNVAPNTDGTATYGFVNPVDFVVDSLMWRNNTNVSFPTIVALMVPVNLLADYHIKSASPAFNSGSANGVLANPTVTVNAPSSDIDSQPRPALNAYDRGADEIQGKTVNLLVTNTDGVSQVNQNAAVTYTIKVSNSGPDDLVGATIADPQSTPVFNGTVGSWLCTGSAGATCAAGGGTGSISGLGITVPSGGSVTLTVPATVGITRASVVNTATVTVPGDTAASITSNTSATDTDTVFVPKPTLAVLDNFNRGNSATLGTNWSLGNNGGVSVNSNQATEANTIGFGSGGTAYWNAANVVFGASQGAAFIASGGTINGDSLILKASGIKTGGVYPRFIRVQYSGGTVSVGYTTNGGTNFVSATTNGVTLNTNDILTAVANADGSVDVWTTSGATTTYVGNFSTTAATGFTGTGQIGFTLPFSVPILQPPARVDNFAGGNV